MATATCTTCNDISKRFDRLERMLKDIQNTQEDLFRQNQNNIAVTNKIYTSLGNGKLNWLEIAGIISSILAAVTGIANVVQIWAQGAYLSKILKASTEARQKANDAQYAAETASRKLDTVLEKSNNAEYAATQANIKLNAQQNWLNQFGSAVQTNLFKINDNVSRLQNSSFEMGNILIKLPQQVASTVGDDLNVFSRDISERITKILEGATTKIKESIKSPSTERIIERGTNQINETIRLANRIQEKATETLKNELTQVRREIKLTETKITNEVKQPSPPSGQPQQNNQSIERKLAEITALIAPFPALIAANANSISRNLQNLPNTPAFQNAVATATCNSGCSKAAAGQRNAIQDALNNQNNKLDALNAGLNTAQLGLLKKIDATTVTTLSRVGDQLKGGISGKLTRMGDLLNSSPVISWLNLLVTLHNGAQLSTNLVITLGEVLSQGLALFGVKDSEGSPIDINKILGQQATSLIIKILGQEAWEKFKREWALYSTVLRSAGNIIDTARSMADSVGAVASIAAENTGKIGNAMLEHRVLPPNAFPAMPENVTPYSAPIQRLQNLEEAADALSMVLGETQSVIDAKKELDDQQREFTKALEEADPRTRAANKPIEEAMNEAKTASAATPVTGDTPRGPAEEDGFTG